VGWNDRIVDESPYIPYEAVNDRDDYENWQMYLEHCRQHPDELCELSSQNVNPADLQPEPAPDLGVIGRLFRKLKDLISK
jgi:hypothetical protein